MIVRHLCVREPEMGESVIDRIGKSRNAADIGRLADPIGADRMTRRGGGGEIGPTKPGSRPFVDRPRGLFGHILSQVNRAAGRKSPLITAAAANASEIPTNQ